MAADGRERSSQDVEHILAAPLDLASAKIGLTGPRELTPYPSPFLLIQSSTAREPIRLLEDR